MKNADWCVLGILAHPEATQHRALAVCPALVGRSYHECVCRLSLKFFFFFTEKAPCVSISQEIGLSLYNHPNQTSFPSAIRPLCFPIISTPTEEFPGARKEGGHTRLSYSVEVPMCAPFSGNGVKDCAVEESSSMWVKNGGMINKRTGRKSKETLLSPAGN